ncbi:hypothetical protein Psi01_25830 [Planobispora siamensis]|uniref:Uncharacterized protein n=1 Tax=Planobispora siamensis TaxID=936338 RepID=A0A8J3WJS1_9ACTN|nr:hypothetical protein Psi01_25830 [Planobispora siamensis]
MGPVESQTRADIEALGPLTRVQPSLAETAYTLARALDEGAGLSTAAIARELRSVLTEIAKVVPESREDTVDDLAARRAARRATAADSEPAASGEQRGGRSGGTGRKRRADP